MKKPSVDGHISAFQHFRIFVFPYFHISVFRHTSATAVSEPSNKSNGLSNSIHIEDDKQTVQFSFVYSRTRQAEL